MKGRRQRVGGSEEKGIRKEPAGTEPGPVCVRTERVSRGGCPGEQAVTGGLTVLELEGGQNRIVKLSAVREGVRGLQRQDPG